MSDVENPILILGGGFSGLSLALALLEHGEKVIVVEKSNVLGGLAYSVGMPNLKRVAAGYHHIVRSDLTLIKYLKRFGLYDRVCWKKVSVLSLADGSRISMSSIWSILKTSYLTPRGKLSYFIFGIRCLLKRRWKEWEKYSVYDLVLKYGNKEVLEKIIDPLIKIKFGFNSRKANAAWFGSRIRSNESGLPLGYIPNVSWTEELYLKFEKEIRKKGGVILMGASVEKILFRQDVALGIKLNNGKKIRGKCVVSSLSTPILVSILDKSAFGRRLLKKIKRIKYISTYSLIMGLPFEWYKNYWTIFLSPKRIFGGCFNLSALNPTLKTHGDKAVVNLFTNLSEDDYAWSKERYLKRAREELRDIFGHDIKPNWEILNFIPYVSPVFGINYQNPGIDLGGNVFLTGIYRTFPRLSSTGSAMASGEETAQYLLSKFSS